jgi:signal transduction histidine kinase/ActR/RegA family two-component response regulator
MQDINTEKQFRNLVLEEVPSGIGVYDITSTTVRKEYLNNGYFQMLGADREKRHQYDGTNTIDAVHPDDLKPLLSQVRAAIREARPLHCRVRLLDGNNNYHWVELAANHSPLDENTERFYVAYYDIDELVKTQTKLENNKLIIQEALRQSDTIHFVYYLENKHYEILALPEELKEYIPMAMDNFPASFIKAAKLSKEDGDKYAAMVKRIDEGASEASCTVQVFDTGKYTWYQLKMRPVKDSNSKIIRAVGSATNIENYKKAEETFLTARRNLANMQGNIISVSCLNVTKDIYTQLEFKRLKESFPACLTAEQYDEALKMEPDLRKQGKVTRDILINAAQNVLDKKQRSILLTTCCNENLKRQFSAGKREINLTYRTRLVDGLIWLTVKMFLMEDPDNGDLLALTFSRDINTEVIINKLTNRIVGKNYEAVIYYDLYSKKLYRNTSGHKTGNAFTEIADHEQQIEDFSKKVSSATDIDTLRQQLSLANFKAQLEISSLYTLYFTLKEKHTNLPGSPNKQIKFDAFYLDEQKDIIVCLESDITEIFEAEKKNRQQLTKALQAAEAANLAKTEFLSRISHDIRTPLGIISNMTDFALADIHDENALQNDLAKIKSADTFLLSLINDVLDISKIDSGKIQLNPEPFTYEEHFTNNKNMLQPMCEAKNLHFEFRRINTDVGVIVADKIRLNQITLNLLSNAVKYTPPGGSIICTSTTEKIPPDKIKYGFEVSDTGIGMSKEFQKKMFEPFEQEHDNPLRPGNMSGTGLGLSIVKKLVDLMGGTISVDSERGKGTTIRVSIVFPNALCDARYECLLHKDKKKQSSIQKDLQGTILVAEDHPINAEIAKRILHSFGLNTIHAKNGKEAVELFNSAAPNTYIAILMDIQMPIMNGYEATKHIRALNRPDAKSIPIIAMTADAFANAMDKGLSSGMNEYLVKPLNPQKLYAVLKEKLKK